MDFKTSKLLGGIGALLMFIGAILLFIDFFACGITEIIGVIFVLISLYGLASFYKDNGIFNNALFGVLASIIGVIISGVALVTVILSSLSDFLYQIFPDWNGDIASLPDLTPNPNNLDLSTLSSFFTGLLLVIVVFCVFTIIAALFVRKSLKDLATRSGTSLFATVGILLLIGALLTMLLLGILLIWVAALLLAIAFFTMKEPEPTPPLTTTPPPTPSTYT